MNYIKWISLIFKIVPCAIAVVKAIEEAKKDDDEVDMAEGLQIAEDFFKCLLNKMGIDIDDEPSPKPE